MSTVFLFPGQSSADPTALNRARRAHPAAEAVAAEATAVLGPADAGRYLGGDTATLETNRDVQIVVFLASQMYLRALESEGVRADASLGLSLGEYGHLVHIGALTFAEALTLVNARGRCYDRAPQGVMVTVLGADRETVTEVVGQATTRGCAVISNFNAPTQHVVAGDDEAVGWVATTLEDDHGAHTMVIERRVPMHSPLMAGVAREFGETLSCTAWRTPVHTYRPNVTAQPVASPSAGDFITHLTSHVSSPVLWDRSLDAAAADHPEATFVEVGPGVVLHNILGRAWKRLNRAHVDKVDAVDPRVHFAATAEALRVRG